MKTKMLILVADDSAFMRAAITHLLVSDPRLAVVGRTASGEQAVRFAQELNPEVVASSTGGPAALAELLRGVEFGANATTIVVQHLPAGYTGPLAAQLQERAIYPIRGAQAGEPISVGSALIAPGGHHLELGRDRLIRLNDWAPVHGVQPPAAATMKSVALAYGARTLRRCDDRNGSR